MTLSVLGDCPEGDRPRGRLGAEQVEPEHLLPALAHGATPASRAIAEAGLDAQAIEAAMRSMSCSRRCARPAPRSPGSSPARRRAERLAALVCVEVGAGRR